MSYCTETNYRTDRWMYRCHDIKHFDLWKEYKNYPDLSSSSSKPLAISLSFWASLLSWARSDSTACNCCIKDPSSSFSWNGHEDTIVPHYSTPQYNQGSGRPQVLTGQKWNVPRKTATYLSLSRVDAYLHPENKSACAFDMSQKRRSSTLLNIKLGSIIIYFCLVCLYVVSPGHAAKEANFAFYTGT